MKLSPRQIYSLAAHVEAAFQEHPIPEPSAVDVKIDDVLQAAEQEPWEVHLTKAVNADAALPTYETIETGHEELLEFLVSYYSSP